MHIGERIYKLRTERKMSQGDLADALDVSRQSISKWETNSSVPELDKLVKLSEIFGVTLDELIRDKQPPEQAAEPAPKVIYVEQSAPISAQRIAGIVLLCFAALLWLMIALFGDILAGLVLASPFLGCGLVCLLVRKHAGLWCCWVVYLFIDIYLRFATGVNWQFVFLPYAYSGALTIHLIVAWCQFAIFASLTAVTARFTRKWYPGSLRNDLIGTVSGWGAYLITRFIFVAPRMQAEDGVVMHSAPYRFVSAVSGWVRNIVLVVAVVFTLRFIASLLEKRKQK